MLPYGADMASTGQTSTDMDSTSATTLKEEKPVNANDSDYTMRLAA